MDTHRQGRRWVALLAVSALIVLAGCAAFDTGVPTPEPPDSDEVAQQYGNLSEVSGVINSTVVYANGSAEQRRIRQRYNLRTGYTWSEVLAANGPKQGDIFAYNGSFIWKYDASRNEVRLLEYTARSRKTPSSRVMTAPNVFEFLEEKGTMTVRRNRDEKVNPLPAVPVRERAAAPTVARNETYVISYLGTEVVDGRKTHVVGMNGSGRWVTNRTVHYDAEWYYPVKSTVTIRRPERTYKIIARYENVTFNPGLSRAAYTFDPPTNATRITRSRGPKISDTYDELAERAIMPVPEPAFPASFTFQSGYEQFANFSGVQVSVYRNDEGDSVTIAKFDSKSVVSRITEKYDTETVQICGVTGYYVDGSGEQQVVWRESATEYGPSTGQREYRIWGTVDRTTLLQIARSIQC